MTSKPQEKLSALKWEHPVLQKWNLLTVFYSEMKFINCFLFLWVILPSRIRIRIVNPDPDTEPGTPLNPDQIRIRIRIHSTASFYGILIKHALKRSGLKNLASCWKGDAISSNVFKTVLLQCTESRAFWNVSCAPGRNFKVSSIYLKNWNRYCNGYFFVWKRRVPVSLQ